jgi:hypothetical protein
MNKLNDSEHWWSKAEEARALAELMEHPDTKRIMLGIAQDYEQLAQNIAIRLSLIRPELQ